MLLRISTPEATINSHDIGFESVPAADFNMFAMLASFICSYRTLPRGSDGSAANARQIPNGHERGNESEGYSEVLPTARLPT